MPSSRRCRSGSRSRPRRSRPVRPATCSASRSRRSLQRAGARSPYRRPRRGVPRLGAGLRAGRRDRPGRTRRRCRCPLPTTPAPTPLAAQRRAGAGRGRAPDAAGPVRRHGRRAASRCRNTARCCRSASSPTACSPTPSWRASCWRARPIRGTWPPNTASAPSGRPSTAASSTMTGTRKRSIPPSSPRKARPCRSRCASAGAGCWATAPAAARAARSPPSSSTTGCAAGRRRSGSRSPTSCWRTRAATGPRSAGWRATSSRSATSARGWRSPSTPASCSRPTPRCARRPGRGSPRGWSRSSSGSRARSTRRTATASTA